MYHFAAFISGFIFSVGLSLSQLVNPNKVKGFLDFFGQWDATLMFVMAGAVGANIFLFKFILKSKRPLFAPKFDLPTKTVVDKRLIVGSAIFGVGWGLVGICPGPGIANLVTLDPKIFGFVGAMLVGMLTFKFLFDQN